MLSLMYNDQIIEYTLARNAKKNINFMVKSNGEIHISAPRYVRNSEIDKLISEKADWLIANHLKAMEKKQNKISPEISNSDYTFLNGKKYFIKIVPGESNQVYVHSNFLTIQIKENYIDNTAYINSFFEGWLKKTMYDLCDGLINEYLVKLKKYHLAKPELSIRNMTSRWGSCIPSKNKITINKNLIYPPYTCLEYVVLHELAHLIEPNHGKNFYKIIEHIMPDWEERKNILNNF